jgi:ERCC4-type nuclease
MGPVLIIDHREQAIKDVIGAYEDFSHEILWENLPVGDFAIREGADTTPLLLIERKTIKDLAASIKDGRYRNQKEALMAAAPPLGVFYIIEGAISFSPHARASLTDGISYKAIVSAILNTCIRDKIHVFITKDLEETMDLVIAIFGRVTSLQTPHPTQTTHAQAPKRVHDKTSCYLAQLCQIPGVSMKTAEGIAGKYHTMNELCCAIREHGKAALADVKTGENKRAISSTVRDRVVEYNS